MATKRWILFPVAAAMLSLFAGCGGSTANVQNPPPPPPPDVTVTVTTSATSIPVSGTVTLTATITGPANIVSDGVVWNLSCQGATGSACGTLSSTSSQSGASIMYTAPSTISANTVVAEIVALAEGYQSANDVSPITITTFDSCLQAGTYILQAQGVDSNNNPYQIVAALPFDGQGNIGKTATTKGEQTANYLATGSVTTTGLTGTYFLGNDGRGLITINTNDNQIGGNGVETFPFVFRNYPQNNLNCQQNTPENPQALVSQVDVGNAATGASAVGTLDLQETSVAAPSGSYAFVMKGTNVVNNLDLPFAFGGVLNIPSGQTAISGVTDEIVDGKLKLSDGTFLTGSQLMSSPDTLGQVTFNLVGLVDGAKPVTATFAGYIVDATHIDLIETDTTSGGTVKPLGLTGGLAIGQTAGSYGTFNNASFNGPYVFGVTGVDLSPLNSSYTPLTWTAAYIFTADGKGCQNDSCNGYTDTFLLDNCVQSTCKTGGISGAQISAQFTGSYVVDSSTASCGSTSGTVVTGTGRACLTPSTFDPAPVPLYTPELFFYLTNPTGTGEALVLGMGDSHYPSLGTGVAYPQSTASATFAGDYGLSFAQEANGTETDGSGQMIVDQTPTVVLPDCLSPVQICGLADASQGVGQGNSFLGTFNSPSAAPFLGTLDANANAPQGVPAGVFPPVGTGVPMTVDYYFIDPTQGFFIETDLVTQATTQVSFGYYSVRAPLCTGCP
ncbi:MAG: hypothetical protein WBQ43_03855 [Terriglobales bacterium]